MNGEAWLYKNNETPCDAYASVYDQWSKQEHAERFNQIIHVDEFMKRMEYRPEAVPKGSKNLLSSAISENFLLMYNDINVNFKAWYHSNVNKHRISTHKMRVLFSHS